MQDKDWTVFYEDGSQADSDTSVYDIPRVGVEIIVQYSERVGYEMIKTDGDYYVYDPNRGGWRITDSFGMWDYLVTVRQPVVLFGRNMDDAAFMELLRKVQDLCGEKLSWLRRERRPK